MDKRQKQVFRLVTLLPAFPAIASGTLGGAGSATYGGGSAPGSHGIPDEARSSASARSRWQKEPQLSTQSFCKYFTTF